MNDGMKIILERMKTHPEEFKITGKSPFSLSGKWIGLVGIYEDSLPEEDMKVFKEALNSMKQEEFTAKVMEELLDPKEEQLSLDLKGDMQRVGTTQGLYSYGIGGNATLLAQQQLQVEHMKAHLEALKKEETKKPHKTLFGKLFNYS